MIGSKVQGSGLGLRFEDRFALGLRQGLWPFEVRGALRFRSEAKATIADFFASNLQPLTTEGSASNLKPLSSNSRRILNVELRISVGSYLF